MSRKQLNFAISPSSRDVVNEGAENCLDGTRIYQKVCIIVQYRKDEYNYPNKVMQQQRIVESINLL